MRKIICVIIALVMVLCLFGCGDKNAEPVNNEQKAAEAIDNIATAAAVNETATAVAEPDLEKGIPESTQTETTDSTIENPSPDESIGTGYSARLNMSLFDNYVYYHPDLDIYRKYTPDWFYKFVANGSFYLYMPPKSEDNVFIGSSVCAFDSVFDKNLIGTDLKHFISDIGDSISADELSSLLGVNLVNYSEPQAEAGYINWFGESLFVIERGDYKECYAVYIYSSEDNPLNSDMMLSDDSLIIFKYDDQTVLFDPLKCIERNSWLDNSELVFSFAKCPFAGMPYDAEGVSVGLEFDFMDYFTYTDPVTGWVYDIQDFDKGKSEKIISEKSVVWKLTLPAKDIFPEMPESISFEDFKLKYASLKCDMSDKQTPDTDVNENVLMWVWGKGDKFTMEEDKYIGLVISVDGDESGQIHWDSPVELYRQTNFYELD